MSIEHAVEPFEYHGGAVEPGQTEKFQYPVSETYLGDPVKIPVTIVNGSEPGPTVFLSAAIHGDELNGIEVVREVVDEWDHDDIHGCLVGLPVLNVPGFTTQQRYLPIYERDLNRAFPGKPDSTSAYRIAHKIYENFIAPCDLGLDFHTSTRGRTNMFQLRANMDDDAVARLARAFGSNVILAGQGSEGMLRREATDDDIPTITIEMGEAHRFEREMIEEALDGVRSVFAEYGIYPRESVRWPGWRTTIEGWSERTWLRADTGGIVDMRHEKGDLVQQDEVICRITSPFMSDVETVRAPFTGLLVGVLENPVVYPGNPLCHFAELDEQIVQVIESIGDEPRSGEP
ncbi:MAG: succinylglutamate desuccinylase/aspartoacylase family protein [Halobacteriales archaeon]